MMRRWMVVGGDVIIEEVSLERMVRNGDCVGFRLWLSGYKVICAEAGWTRRFVRSKVWLNGVGLSGVLSSEACAAAGVRRLSVIGSVEWRSKIIVVGRDSIAAKVQCWAPTSRS